MGTPGAVGGVPGEESTYSAIGLESGQVAELAAWVVEREERKK